jgi:hypothetical protein
MSNTESRTPPKTQHRKQKRRVFLVGSVTLCCSSLLLSVLCFWWGPLLVLPIIGFWWDLWLHVAHLFSFLCCVFGGVHDCVLLISLVFCVVFMVGFVTACCLSLYFSVLCFWWGPLLSVAHLRFLVGFRDSVLLISLVFCVVFLVGSVTPCCLSL